ncbi:MAG: rod shape-determining protein MreC [Prevotella sp.]|nr:rod shape-determining protein MreC [Prevotella sp.]
MRRLIALLVRNYHYPLFLLLEIAGIVLLVRHNNYQGSVWFSSANVVVGKCNEWSSTVVSYFNLRETNSRLTAENVRLARELEGVRERVRVLQTDSMAVKASVPAGYRTVNARVVESSISRRDNLLTIDKGSADGVKKNMGVVSGSGAAGIVYLVGTHYSVVIPLINDQSNVSCSIRDRGYFGYLSWTGGDPRYAYMEDVPRYAHYRKGDIVETSGFSSVFPRGVAVGKVLCTFNSPDGLSYRIKVELATDFAKLYDVCVVDNSRTQEQLEILRAAQDSLSRPTRMR